MSALKEKILAKMNEPTMAVFATTTEDGKPWARYVVVFADQDLTIWFATFTASRKIGQIEKNPEVHLTLGAVDPMNSESYLQIQGKAEILTDAETKQAIWYEHLQNVFAGPEDPAYCVCKVVPYQIEFTVAKPGHPPEIWTAE